MRVLFVAEAGESACREVRADIPAEGLRELGYDVDVTSVVFENADHKLYGFDHVTETQLSRPGVVVVRHTRGPEGEEWDSVKMYEGARKKGQRIFYDMDDDLWNIPEWNPASKWVTPDVQRLIVRNVNACDGLLVSTDAIATQAQEHGVTVPTFVVPNGVRATAYYPHYDENRPLRLGWFGATRWRSEDLYEIGLHLADVLHGKNVEFWHIGYVPGEPHVQEFMLSPERVVEYPWVPLADLPRVIGMMDCAIVPLRDVPFNHARSNVFALRLSASGVVWAATATREHEKLFVQGAGYLVHHPNGWDHALHVLVDDEYEEARRNMRAGGVAVARLHDPVATARKYAEIFDA